MNEEEIWIPVNGCPDREVSSFGRFRRKLKNGRYKFVNPYFSKRNKECMIKLPDGQASAKRLVAEHFVENPSEGIYVKSRDGNPLNIRPENLYWTNYSGGGYTSELKIENDNIPLSVTIGAWTGSKERASYKVMNKLDNYYGN